MYSILLIDDQRPQLDELVAALRGNLQPNEVAIRTWEPREEIEPLASFSSMVDENTILVVTDHDLTTGTLGLFGSTVIAWCQARAIPVGDYSRGRPGSLPKEANLFELRVPNIVESAAPYIAAIFRGFRTIKEQLSLNATRFEKKRSPAAVLAELLGVPEMESQFTMYGGRLGTSNSALLDLITRTASDAIEPSAIEKQDLLAYILGHTLVNAILRFPGPLLSIRALRAYTGCEESESSTISELFSQASYAGPFCELDRFFWLFKVDDILQPLIDRLPEDFQAETPGQRNREAVELSIGRQLTRHSCVRCAGLNGGFLCPFTNRIVCQRADCSVGSSSWIPQGAKISRIERDFYDEWSPILGI